MRQVTQRLAPGRGSTFSGDIGKVRAACQGTFFPLEGPDPEAGQGGVCKVVRDKLVFFPSCGPLMWSREIKW